MTAVDLARLVKPLEWRSYAGGQSLAVDRFSGLYTLDGDDWTHSSMAGWLGGGKAMADKHHAARVIAALDADLLAELVGALAEAKVDIGTYVDQDYPPNTCAQYPDVARRHFRDMELCRRIDAILAKLDVLT